MEVTRSNFREILPNLVESFKQCLFISFDQEFTGLGNELTRNPFATLGEFYNNKLRSTAGFIVIQFGLTCFFLDDDDPKKIRYKSYNFYVYPRNRGSCFQCEGDAMSFLARNRFNFNKLFDGGISFCDIAEGERQKNKLVEKQTKRAEQQESGVPDTSQHIPVGDQDKALVDTKCEQIDTFLESSEKELHLESLNSYQRLLIYQALKSKYFGKVTASTDKNVLVIKKCGTVEAKKQLEEDTRKKEEADLEDKIGMTALIQALSDSKKLIVGHNIYLDLLYMMRQFFGPLPNTFDEYKEFLHNAFPLLLDTKYLSTANEELKAHIPSSVLNDLLTVVRKEPFQLPEINPVSDEYAYDLDSDKQHEAGFDSFICGLSFLGMVRAMDIELEELNAICSNLRPFLNKIFIMGINDTNMTNLSGRDATQHREHVFHISFPATWKQTDIVNKFKPYSSVNVSWRNDTSAFVELHRKDYAKSVLNAFRTAPDMKIQTYAEFARSQQESKNENSSDRPPQTTKRQSQELLTTVVKKAKVDVLFPVDKNWSVDE